MTDTIHILVANIFFAPYSYGGATIVAEEVSKALKTRHNVRVTAVSLMHRSDLLPYYTMKVEQNGITNYLINVPPGRSYAEHYDNPGVTEAVAALMEQLNPDLLHAHCIQEMGAGLLSLAHLRKVPIILSVHDFWWLCERQFMIKPSRKYCAQDPIMIKNCRGCVDDLSRAKLRMERLIHEAAKADLITFPSVFARDLCVASGMKAASTAVWENGVRLPEPEFFRRQAARRKKDPRTVFGFVGGPSQIKGWPLVRSTFANLVRNDFSGIVVDGSLDGNWYQPDDLAEFKGDWRIHPRFSQDDMDAFYAQIDVLLFLSQWKETFGLTIREAVARGIEVIQTDSGGTTEWAGADRAQMLAIGDGPAVLAQKVNQTLTSKPRGSDPVAVQSFADQADALMAHVTEILASKSAA